MRKRKIQSVLFFRDQNNKKQFLLLKMNSNQWQNVTGSVDEGEEFLHAAIREAQEETNLLVSNIKNILLTDLDFEFSSRWGDEVIEKIYIIECQAFWEVILDPTEHCAFKWVSEDKIDKRSVHFESNFTALQKAILL